MQKISIKISIFVMLVIFTQTANTASPANAQLKDIIGGIVNEAINSNQRKQQRRQQQRQIDNQNRQIQNQRREAERQRQAEQKQIQREENERKVAFYKRMQVALKTLGFYKAGIDGDFGSGSQKAYRQYTSAFEIPNSDFNFANIFKMEEHARSGWRSLLEMREAQKGGFNERGEYLEAREHDFKSRDNWIDANRKGFTIYKEYTTFIASGISDPNEYRLVVQQQENRKRALEFCQTAVADGKWIDAEKK